jgi:hypothetical protein
LKEAARRGVVVTLLLQARVEYLLLHFATARSLRPAVECRHHIQEYHRSMLHAKVAVVDDHWATVGSSNIDPYSILMAREGQRIRSRPRLQPRAQGAAAGDGKRWLAAHRRRDWESRPKLYKAAIWISYGIVRLAMGFLGYGGNEWFRKERTNAPLFASRDVLRSNGLQIFLHVCWLLLVVAERSRRLAWLAAGWAAALLALALAHAKGRTSLFRQEAGRHAAAMGPACLWPVLG